MATPVQNLTQTLTGLLNGTAPTNAQLTNVGAGFLFYMTDDDALAQFGHIKSAMTNQEIAAFAQSRIRAYVKQMVYASGVEATNAANAAAAAAAGSTNASGL